MKKKGTETGAAIVLPFRKEADYFYKKGVACFQKGDFKRAKRYMFKACELEPYNPNYAVQLAILLTEMGEFEFSNAILQKIINELDPSIADCYYLIANNFAHLGLFQEAMKYAEKYLELEEDGEFLEDAEDLVDLLTLEMEDLGIGLEVEDELIMKQEQARRFIEEGKLEEAISLLENLIKDYPEFWAGYNNLALAYFYLGNTIKAHTILDDILEKNPGNLHALCNMLVFRYYERNNEEISRLASILENVYPLIQEQQYKLGATFALVGKHDLAFKWLRSLEKTGFVGDSTFYYWLTIVCYYTGKEVLAHKYWAKLEKSHPEKAITPPWAIEEYTKLPEFLEELIHSDRVPDRLHGLYLIFQSEFCASFLQSTRYQEIVENDTLDSRICRVLAGSSNSDLSLVQAINVANLLFRNNQGEILKEIETTRVWFELLEHLIKEGHHFDNDLAWAAAIDYMWHKEQGLKVSQAQIATTYNISVATVAKYAKYIKMLEN